MRQLTTNQLAIGGSFVIGRSDHGADETLLANADGHLDAETGPDIPISTQCRIKAAPAFVVDRQVFVGQEDNSQ